MFNRYHWRYLQQKNKSKAHHRAFFALKNQTELKNLCSLPKNHYDALQDKRGKGLCPKTINSKRRDAAARSA